jgi:hypothetical protein
MVSCVVPQRLKMGNFLSAEGSCEFSIVLQFDLQAYTPGPYEYVSMPSV